MSWETLKWAGDQRTDNVAMQCTLFVIANAADPDGVAFRWWPHPHHWWKYLQERTGLAHGSIYRVLKRLEEVGLIERETGPAKRGHNEPLVRLRMDQIYVAPAKSPSETVAIESPSGTPESPSETDVKSPSLPERLNESPSETPHIMSPYLNPSPNPKSLSPEQAASEASPPREGEGEASTPQSPPEPQESADSPEMQKKWKKFCSTYPGGVRDLNKAEKAFFKLPLPQARDCAAGAELYAGECKLLPKKKPDKAHLFITKRTWAGLLSAKPATKRVVSFTLVPVNTEEGRAIAKLYLMTDPGSPVRCHGENGRECYSVPAKPNPQVMAFANVRHRSQWNFYEERTNNWFAWRDFVTSITGKSLVIRSEGMRRGILAPHPWPPRIDGTWSESPESPPSTGPPSVPQMTEDDIDAFTQWGN